MAKKKRKRHRRPVAPPVHSAPESLHGPAGVPPTEAPPSRPFAPEPPPTPGEPSAHAPMPSGVRAREAARQRERAKRKRGRQRTWFWVAGVVIVLAGAIAGRQILSNRAGGEFDRLLEASGCTKVRTTGSAGGGQHLQPGERTSYDTSPPTHGAHDLSALPAGIYTEPFSKDPNEDRTIYKAVHSLEHGYIVIWHNRLTKDEQRALEREYRGERKVIVAPYPELRRQYKVALTAWGRLSYCERPDPKVIDGFIERFREARTAPEPKAV